MKKLSFLFFALAAIFWLASCASDGSDGSDGDGGCSMKGEWKVKTADLSSDKLDTTILAASKSMTMKRKYSFKGDSITVSTGNPAEGNYVGVYSVENEQLIINALGSKNGISFKDSLKITNCTGSEVSLLKRIPADSTKPSIVKTMMTLEKSN